VWFRSGVAAIACQLLLVGRALHVSDVFDKIKTEFVKAEKQIKGQRRRSEIEATLQQGLQLRAECSAAGQFWTFTMSNSKALVIYASRTFKARE
jgi:hypothetical protein